MSGGLGPGGRFGRRPIPRLALAALGALLGLSCGPQPAEEPAPEPVSPPPSSAKSEIVEALRKDLDTQRHASDGGGRAWIEEGPMAIEAGTPGRWHLVYEAGPLGVSEGGWVFLQTSPFWGWSTPQVLYPDRYGYTEVSTSAKGVLLEPATLDQQLLGIQIRGRGLEAGERLEIVFGAGPAGALADRYAERGEHLWIAVDGDGDGVRALLSDSPAVEVLPGPPALLVLTVASTARVGDRPRLTVAILDGHGNAGLPVEGEVLLSGPDSGLGFPRRIRLQPSDRGAKSVDLEALEEGVYRLQAEGFGALGAESNPLVVSQQRPPIWWGDLHGHSNFSDGTGTPEDYFRYARDVASLDIASLTDHDHWGMRPLSTHPEMWAEIQRQVELFHQPRVFVTVPGFEWTSWIHGHRHVLSFDGPGEVLSSVDPAFESPLQLWEALRGRDVLTFAHHSAGGPIATNWEIPPNPELEPVTEVASVHGSSEALDSPAPIYSPVAGNFVRDALDRGYRLGFVGSGDGHDGHPGLSALASPSGGLAAVLCEELTRADVLAALRSRRTYATNGARIVLRASLAGHPMGASLSATELGADPELAVAVAAVDALERIDVVRSGQVVKSLSGGGRRSLEVQYPVPGLASGEYVYVRAVQENGGAAWSSPFFID